MLFLSSFMLTVRMDWRFTYRLAELTDEVKLLGVWCAAKHITDGNRDFCFE